MKQQERLHNKDVKAIAKNMASFYRLGKKVRVYHGSTTSTRTQHFKKDEMIDVSMLTRILEVNTKKGYAIVEPNVPVDALYKAIIPYGFVPPVVMELPGITVGGGIQGIAGENSSFKWGAFHETCSEYEVVLGNGKIMTISPQKHADLFWGIAGSYGSIAIITKVKLKIIPAKPYIKLTYVTVKSFAEGVALMNQKLHDPIGFIEAYFYAKNFGTVMYGVLSDKGDSPISHFLRAYNDWFYLHAEKISRKQKVYTELIPLEDYLFRHNRGAYWMGTYVFEKLHIPFNRITRFLLNPLLKERIVMRFLQSINVSQRHFVQDFVMPIATLQKMLEYADKKIGIYPLLICPGYSKNNVDKLASTHIKNAKLVYDVGVYGHIGLEYPEFVRLNRDAEKKTKELGGRKWLYAHQYYTQDEFWDIYDKKWYANLRKKYFAERVFPDVYEKTHVKEKYTYSAVKGLWSVLLSPFKLPVS